MKFELADQLYASFPRLYWRRKDGRSTLKLSEAHPITGFECGSGWFKIILEMSEQLDLARPRPEIFQIKEKFGTLRVYLGEPDRDTRQIVVQAEFESSRTCEHCGDSARTQNADGWLTTYCPPCLAAWQKELEND